jgi:4-oxalocrotonate tautomerase
MVSVLVLFSRVRWTGPTGPHLSKRNYQIKMPYINVRLIEDNISAEDKREVISQITQVMVDVLGKDPESIHIVIDEIPLDNWGLGGQSVTVRRSSKEVYR